PRSMLRWTRDVLVLVGTGLTLIDCSANESDATDTASVGAALENQLAWSRDPPEELKPTDIPQLVSVTFDDNFGLAALDPPDPQPIGGINDIVAYYKGKNNPAGSGNADHFDGTPIGATFYYTSIYLSDESKTVIACKPGEDRKQGNRKAWTAAFKAGHEVA